MHTKKTIFRSVFFSIGPMSFFVLNNDNTRQLLGGCLGFIDINLFNLFNAKYMLYK